MTINSCLMRRIPVEGVQGSKYPAVKRVNDEYIKHSTTRPLRVCVWMGVWVWVGWGGGADGGVGGDGGGYSPNVAEQIYEYTMNAIVLYARTHARARACAHTHTHTHARTHTHTHKESHMHFRKVLWSVQWNSILVCWWNVTICSFSKVQCCW